MRVLVRYGLALLLIAGIQGSAGQAVADINPARESNLSSQQSANRPCDEERYEVKPAMGTEVVRAKVRALIRCAVSRWPVPGGLSKAWQVADDESSYWAWAHNNGCLGVYQEKDLYWVERARTYLRSSWFNDNAWARVLTVPGGAYLARANVLVAIRTVNRQGSWDGWSTA